MTAGRKRRSLMMEAGVFAIAPTAPADPRFGIPMLEYVNLNDQRVQELVLAPTRELCLQLPRNCARFRSY
jgi:hypothetical protein